MKKQITTHPSNWYVLYTYPNFEKKIYNNLLNRSVEAFLPLQKVVRQWSDRKKTIEVPLFPNYIFVYTNKLERYKSLDIPGVVRFVSFESQPLSICAKEIETIKKLVGGGDILSIDDNMEEGDHVKVTTGPFAGLSGVLFERKGKKRFGIKIPSINQTLSIEIATSCMEKIENLKSLISPSNVQVS